MPYNVSRVLHKASWCAITHMSFSQPGKSQKFPDQFANDMKISCSLKLQSFYTIGSKCPRLISTLYSSCGLLHWQIMTKLLLLCHTKTCMRKSIHHIWAMSNGKLLVSNMRVPSQIMMFLIGWWPRMMSGSETLSHSSIICYLIPTSRMSLIMHPIKNMTRTATINSKTSCQVTGLGSNV